MSNAKAEDDVPWQESVYANLTESGKAILLHNRATLDKCTLTVDIYQTVLWLRSQRLKTVQQDVSCPPTLIMNSYSYSTLFVMRMWPLVVRSYFQKNTLLPDQ